MNPTPDHAQDHGQEAAGQVPLDLLGRPVVTVEAFDRMSPAEQQASYDAAIITDLDQLAPGDRDRILARVYAAIDTRDDDHAAGWD